MAEDKLNKILFGKKYIFLYWQYLYYRWHLIVNMLAYCIQINRTVIYYITKKCLLTKQKCGCIQSSFIT
jgi:hypothetical protein